MESKDKLTFEQLKSAGLLRAMTVAILKETWTKQPLTYWATAIAGECGEFCNLVKKSERDRKDLVDKMGSELADIVIYADLIASKLYLNLGDLVRNKFNEVSDRYVSSVRL